MKTELETILYQALCLAVDEANGWFDECRGGNLPADIGQVFEDAMAQYEGREPNKLEDDKPLKVMTQEEKNVFYRSLVDLIASGKIKPKSEE